MDNSIPIDFVLVRGPSSIQRRLTIRIPADGKPATIGRAPHCTALLDPLLLFASQVQCSIVAIPCPDTATLDVTPPPRRDGHPHTPCDSSTPGVAAEHHTHRFYITDMCSSNGTFVNGCRISSTSPTLLRAGDRCIFGGMRDVAVGEELPCDAFAGPELVQWQLQIGSSADAAAAPALEATPLVLPAGDALATEERALLSSVKQSSMTYHHPHFLAEPTPPLHVAEAPEATPTGQAAGAPASRDAVLPQRLFASPQDPSPPMKTAVSPVVPSMQDAEAELKDGEEPSPIPPSTVVTEVVETTSSAAPLLLTRRELSPPPPGVVFFEEPPLPIIFTKVRIGRVMYDVPTVALCSSSTLRESRGSPTRPAEGAAKRARKEKGAATEAADESKLPPQGTSSAVPLATMPAGHTVLFSATHWRWLMPNPMELLRRRDATQLPLSSSLPSPSVDSLNYTQGLLPITSIKEVIICAERLGVAVELKENCRLPLVDAAVLEGGPDNRWIVWLFAETQEETPLIEDPGKDGEQSALISSGDAVSGEMRRGKRGASRKSKQKAGVTDTHKPTTTNAPETESEPLTQRKYLSSRSPTERFKYWVHQLCYFYTLQKLPSPHVVDPLAFDALLQPLG